MKVKAVQPCQRISIWSINIPDPAWAFLKRSLFYALLAPFFSLQIFFLFFFFTKPYLNSNSVNHRKHQVTGETKNMENGSERESVDEKDIDERGRKNMVSRLSNRLSKRSCLLLCVGMKPEGWSVYYYAKTTSFISWNLGLMSFNGLCVIKDS